LARKGMEGGGPEKKMEENMVRVRVGVIER
jgi:hypothetical protein